MDHELNLSELQQRIDGIKQEGERAKKTSRYLFWGIVVLFVASAFSPLVAIGSRNRNAVTQFNVGIDALWIVLIVGIGVNVYRIYKKWAAQFDQYAPDFLPRANWRDVAGLLIGQMWTLTVISILFIVRADFLLIWVIAFPPVIYQKLMAFTFKTIYRGGTKWSDRWLRIFPNSLHLLNMQAINLLHQGDFEAAEKILRRMLASKQRPNFPIVALWLNNLGYCLTLAGKYDEAYPFLVSAINISPDIPNSYDSLASWYLEQKIHPEMALDLAEMALANSRPELKDSVCIQQATGAYAAALTGRITRAEALLSLALEATQRPNHPSILAEVNRQSGYAYLALNKLDEARRHFSRALELDPHGLYGKLAQRALESIASTGLPSQAYT